MGGKKVLVEMTRDRVGEEVKGMGSNMAEARCSQRLQTLLHHFRSSNSISTSDFNLRREQFNGKPSKRAAVLICVFEGADGNLRVILTQRASSLSSHAGQAHFHFGPSCSSGPAT